MKEGGTGGSPEIERGVEVGFQTTCRWWEGKMGKGFICDIAEAQRERVTIEWAGTG